MSSQEDQLAALLLRWEELWEHGEGVPAAQLCAACPDLADQLQAKIDVLKKMAWMKKDAADRTEDAHEAPLVGKTLAGRYRIDQFIGEGGFGQVYRAFDTELQRHVAVKVAHRQTQGTEALLQEARRVAQLRHPGIVAVHDVCRDDKTLFVVSDFIDGENLAKLLESGHPDPWEAARLVAQIADALHFAHEQGFVHRDIKPANVLIDKQGRPLITDFGIAVSTQETQTAWRPWGTLPYMAPETVFSNDHPTNPSADIYALGVIFYELLSGRLPFEANNSAELVRRIQSDEPSPPKAIQPKIPEELQAICLKCLAKDPGSRYATAGDLAQALRSWLAQQPPSFRRTAIVLLLGSALLALVGVFVMKRHRPEVTTPVPTSPADYYRLARQYEQAGQPQEALAAYERCLAFNVEVLDPPMAYLQLLQLQMGPQAAIRFNEICKRFPDNQIYNLAALRLLSGEERRSTLEKFTEEQPPSSLVYLELADCYSLHEMPHRSKIAEARERHYLQQALDLAGRDDFGRYYIDKSMAVSRLEEARRRLSASTNEPLLANVELIQFDPLSKGIRIFDTHAKSISYSLDGMHWKTATSFGFDGGAIRWAVATVANEDARPFRKKGKSAMVKLFVKYTDDRDLESAAAEITPDSSPFEAIAEPENK